MKARFSKLKYQIANLKEPVVTKYPELLRYEPISQAKELPDFDKILRYVIFLYDPNTDLNQEYPDLESRRLEACALAELPKKVFQEFIDLTPAYVSIIQCFLCEIYHNRRHREWHTLLQEIDDFTRLRWQKVNENTDPKKRKDWSTLCDDLHKRADLCEVEIFADHEDVKEVIVADRWSSPERYASPTLKLLDTNA